MNTKRHLWEILVPHAFPDGKVIPVPYHRIWDEKVRKISGGLTIKPVEKGQWILPFGKDRKVVYERMVPVRFMASRAEAVLIGTMTCKYYKQIAVMLYKISSQTIIIYGKEAVGFSPDRRVPMGNVKCLCPASPIQAQSVSSDYFISMVRGYEKKYHMDWLTFYTDHQHSKEEVSITSYG